MDRDIVARSWGTDLEEMCVERGVSFIAVVVVVHNLKAVAGAAAVAQTCEDLRLAAMVMEGVQVEVMAQCAVVEVVVVVGWRRSLWCQRR